MQTVIHEVRIHRGGSLYGLGGTGHVLPMSSAGAHVSRCFRW